MNIKQLCNYIDIVPLSGVQSIENNTINLKLGITVDRIRSEVTPTWSETPSTSTSGTVFNQAFRIVSNKITQDLRAKYPNTLPVVVIMYDDEGSHVLGDLSEFARITIIPSLDKDSIQIAASRTIPVY